MAYYNYILGILAIFSINFLESAAFVPVYMWGTSKLSEHVPALHKISQDSFKDTLLEYLKGDPYIIVFAEHNLSPEDFAQRDQSGQTAFQNMHNLKKENVHVTYKPYVQNPIGAIKQLNKPVTEISIGSLLSSSSLPKNNILVIDLNDAKDEETRYHMLQRHDSDIVSIYKAVLESHENVIAIYTAHHTAWVAPDEITHSRSRNLLQAEDPVEVPDTSISYIDVNGPILMYLTEQGQLVRGGEKINITNSFTLKATNSSENATLTGTLSDTKVDIDFELNNKAGYWYIKSLKVGTTGGEKEDLTISQDLYAPIGFSYHCGEFNVSNKKGDIVLTLPGFQFQAFKGNESFGDAYDCTGFTSVPIWSGLFVTAILLLIITFGLTFMMDIKTMDRFDDPKGKTITITASE